MSRYLAEFVGTFVLVFAGCGAAVLAGDKIGFLGVSLAFGLALLAMAYTVGHVSGCHINPAVTLGLFITRKMERRYLFGYWAAQVLGAIVAAACLLAIAKGTPNGYDAVALGFAANGYDVHSPGHYGVLFFTMLAALLPAQARNAKPNMVRIFKEMVAFIGACCHHEVRTPHTREPFKFALPFTIGFLLLVSPLFAQPPGASKPTPDTLILTDGEKLIGQFLHSTGSSLVFKSDAAGEVTIDWNKVQDL